MAMALDRSNEGADIGGERIWDKRFISLLGDAPQQWWHRSRI